MRSVRRQLDHDDLLDVLTRKHHNDNPKGDDPYAERPAIMETLRDALCFAAMLGYYQDRKVPLKGQTMEIKGGTFEGEPEAVQLIWSLAIADTQGTDILRPENDSQMVQIFEEYANGGLFILNEWMKETNDDAYGDTAIREGLRTLGLLDTSSDKIDKSTLDPGF